MLFRPAMGGGGVEGAGALEQVERLQRREVADAGTGKEEGHGSRVDGIDQIEAADESDARRKLLLANLDVRNQHEIVHLLGDLRDKGFISDSRLQEQERLFEIAKSQLATARTGAAASHASSSAAPTEKCE